MDFKPCFLIISYSPDEDTTRCENLRKIVETLDKYFNWPIIAALRGWHKPLPDSPNFHPIRVEAPGIRIARKVLRKQALASEYNYFIMLDDDMVVDIVEQDIPLFIDMLQRNPTGYCLTYNPVMLKGFAISRPIFEKVDYAPFENRPNIPGTWLGFEDAAFVGECLLRFPYRATLSPSLWDRSDIDGFSLQSSWLDDEATHWLPLQYENTCDYLMSINTDAPRYFRLLNLARLDLPENIPERFFYKHKFGKQ